MSNGVNVSLPLNRNFSLGGKNELAICAVVIDLIKTWAERRAKSTRDTQPRRKSVRRSSAL